MDGKHCKSGERHLESKWYYLTSKQSLFLLASYAYNLDPSRPLQNTYLGSDDYLRARFEEYILSLLSSVKHAQAHNLLDYAYDTMDNGANNSEQVITDENEEHNYLSDYGMKWLMAWGETNNFKKWNQYTDHEIYEIVEPGHPGMGKISMADIQNTLSKQVAVVSS